MTVYVYVALFMLLMLVKPFRAVAGVFAGFILAIVGFILTLITAIFAFTTTVVTDMSKFLSEGH